MKKHIKTKEVRIKLKMHEWVNQNIIELMKRRDKLRIKIIKYREQDLSTNAISNELRHIRNQINIIIRQRKEHYMYQKIRSYGKNNTILWKALSEVVPIKAMVKKSQNEMILQLSADQLNKFFIEEPQNIVNNNIPHNEDFNSMEEKYTESLFQ